VIYLQSKGVVHRDLKPDNVMISKDAAAPEIKLVDFNVAHSFDVETEGSEIEIKGCTGLKNWSAPETRLQLFYGIESESWSIGCLLYFMIYGAPPFNEGSDLKSQI